jgi:hypothetical protein
VHAPRRPDGPPLADLNFDDNSVLLTILQLCSGVGANYGLTQRLPVAPQLAANVVDLRLSPQFTRDSELARRTIAWYLPLLQDWMKILSDPRRPESPLNSSGCKLALLVARHVRDMFALFDQTPIAPRIRECQKKKHTHQRVIIVLSLTMLQCGVPCAAQFRCSISGLTGMVRFSVHLFGAALV